MNHLSQDPELGSHVGEGSEPGLPSVGPPEHAGGSATRGGRKGWSRVAGATGHYLDAQMQATVWSGSALYNTLSISQVHIRCTD